jgi:hypothetical protein
MKEILFEMDDINDENLDIYVDGKYTGLTLNSQMKATIEDLTRLHNIDGMRIIATEMVTQINERVKLSASEIGSFQQQIIRTLKEHIL